MPLILRLIEEILHSGVGQLEIAFTKASCDTCKSGKVSPTVRDRTTA